MVDPTGLVFLSQLPPVWLGVFFVAGVWEAVWKGIGLWKSGRNNQLAWFVCMLIFNTVGILPIVYLLWYQKVKAQKKKR